MRNRKMNNAIAFKQIESKHTRSSNFEILRIICMFLIVAHHYSVHGGFEFRNSISFNRIFVQFLSLGGKLGVNCFVLITGYFSYSKSTVRAKSLSHVFMQVTLFSIAIYGAFVLIGSQPFSLKSVIKASLPLFFGEWWFIRTYFVLNILSPFINQFLTSIDRKSHLKYIITCLILWSVIPTLTTADMEGSNLTWFVSLYIIAAYIAKYNTKFFHSNKIQLVLLISSTALIWLHAIFSSHAAYFASMTNVLLTIQSISLFCVFRGLKAMPNKCINLIAASMFGVYLIHDNSYVSHALWEDLLKNATYEGSNYLIVHAIFSIIIVFLTCTIISLLYNFTIDKVMSSIFDYFKISIEKYKKSQNSVNLRKKYKTLKEYIGRFF